MNSEEKVAGCSFLVGYLLASIIFGILLWPYVINSWLEFAGKEAVIVWWQGGLLGLVPGVGQLSVAAAFFTWILMLFLM